VFTALLDTCVLWPSLQRDLLLSLAAEGLYRPVWSDAILEELEMHETQKLIARGTDPDRASELAHFLLERMRASFDDALVEGWEGLDGTYNLPDPDDEHVVAAAVVGGAGAIVTHNVRDFPPDRLPPHLGLVRPAEFLLNTVSLDPRRALRAVTEIAERSGRKGPGIAVHEILDLLTHRYELTDAVEVLLHAYRSQP
jgi:predicted nucleic acid-binding protein